MRVAWENCLGSDPVLYARKVLRECGFTAPPICEKVVINYLGLKLKEVTKEHLRAYRSRDPQIQEVQKFLRAKGSWLQRWPDGTSYIWVYADLRREPKRLGIFHECSHAIIPWHEGVSHLRPGRDLDPAVHRRIERQAYRCGSVFLFPREMFVRDALSLEIGISAIEHLSHRYVASLEATAIWYTCSHPGLCAVAMVKPAANRKPRTTMEDHTVSEQLILPLTLPSSSIVEEDDNQFPFTVKYFAKSRRFPEYIRPGRRIGEGHPLFKALVAEQHFQGEIWGSISGGRTKWIYNIECIPRGETGKTLVFLWLPDSQQRLRFPKGVTP
jgi:hypothetical protein